MPLSQEFVSYATELIEGFGKVDVKRMFGGAVLSRNGVGFAILDDDTFFLKADLALAAALRKQGCRPWRYSVKKDGTVRDIAYWSLPAMAADDPEEAVGLAKRSFAIALEAGKAKAKKKRPATRPPSAKTVRKPAKRAAGKPEKQAPKSRART